MADPIGIKAKMGMKAVAAWGTAYAAVDTAIPYTDENISKAYERIQKQALLGFGGREPSLQGNKTVQGTVNHELDYNNFTSYLKYVMGAEAAGVVTITDKLGDTANVFQWLEFDKQQSRHRFGASMATKMVISGDHGGLVMLAMDWFCKDRDENAAAFPAITPATPDRVRFSDMVFRIADQVDPIAAGDAVGISNFELEFDRNMKVDDYETDATDPQDAIEPVEGDFRSATLKITIPRYTGTPDFAAWKDADQALQVDMVFSGPSGQSLTIEMPEARIMEGFDSPVGGPGPLTVEGTLELYRSSAGNPMYTGNEFRITVV